MKNKNEEIKRMLYTCTDLHVREAAPGEASSRTITGYAILFDVLSEPLWSDEESEAREMICKDSVTKQLLDGCDIKMTMFHDRQLILARSNNGAGTLTYGVDEKGVYFDFDAPNTVDGDKALELVRRGDIAGCSFIFTTRYHDRDFVERSVEIGADGRKNIIYKVKHITGVYDFTLAADPVYSDTSVEVRGFHFDLPDKIEDEKKPKEENKMREQVSEMRRAASRKLI